MGNFLLYKMSYNGAWWYLLTYIWIVLTDNWFIEQGYLYGMTVFEYAIGLFFAKHNLFAKTHRIWTSIQSNTKYLVPPLLFLAMLLGHTLIVPSLFVAPFIGLVLIIIYHVLYGNGKIFRLLEYIGSHSTI